MMENRKAIATVIRQLLAGLTCLIIGFSAIWLFVVWANTQDVHWADGSKNEFGITEFIFGGMILLFPIIFITVEQFQSSLLPHKVFRLSIRYSLLTLPFVSGTILLFILLLGPTIKLVIFEIIFLGIAAVLLGLVIGAIQACSLLIVAFDPAEHFQLMNKEARLQASRSGVLPYQQQVILIWGIIFSTFLALFFVAFLILSQKLTSGFVLMAITVIGLSIAVVVYFLGMLSNPGIRFVEGQVSSKSRQLTGTSNEIELFKLTCNEQEFFTDSRVWYEISEGKSYRLWYYTLVRKRIVAFEAFQQKRTKRSVVNN